MLQTRAVEGWGGGELVANKKFMSVCWTGVQFDPIPFLILRWDRREGRMNKAN